jgi:hypothetical protein
MITSNSAKTGIRMGDGDERSKGMSVSEGYLVCKWVYFEGVRTAKVTVVLGRKRCGMRDLPREPAPRRRIFLVWGLDMFWFESVMGAREKKGQGRMVGVLKDREECAILHY